MIHQMATVFVAYGYLRHNIRCYYVANRFGMKKLITKQITLILQSLTNIFSKDDAHFELEVSQTKDFLRAYR